MPITNKHNLPQAIVDAVKAQAKRNTEKYDISITSLLTPARQRVLLQRHEDEIQEDAASRVWSLLGQAVHHILATKVDGMDTEKTLIEQRLFMERMGWRISGQPDIFDSNNSTLQDYKLTSTATIGTIKPEWVAQLNLYAHLLRENGHSVKRLEIVAILRDWTRVRCDFQIDYPTVPIIVIPIPLWEASEVERFLQERITAHQSAQTTLPLCTAQERWERTITGNRPQRRMRTTRSIRPASCRDSVRCLSYCAAAPFCDQFQKSKARES